MNVASLLSLHPEVERKLPISKSLKSSAIASDGVASLTWFLALAAALGIVVAAVAVANGGQLSRQRLSTRFCFRTL